MAAQIDNNKALTDYKSRLENQLKAVQLSPVFEASEREQMTIIYNDLIAIVEQKIKLRTQNQIDALNSNYE